MNIIKVSIYTIMVGRVYRIWYFRKLYSSYSQRKGTIVWKLGFTRHGKID